MNDVASGSIFTGQSKFIAGGQNSAAWPPLPLPQRSPGGPTVALCCSASVFSVEKNVFLYLQGKEEQQLPAEGWGGVVGGGCGGDGVLRSVSVALTQEVLSAGPHSCRLKKKTLSHTLTHTLFCLSCVPSFLGVSFIALITTNKQEHPEEAVSPVYISIGDTAQAKYLLVPKREKMSVLIS